MSSSVTGTGVVAAAAAAAAAAAGPVASAVDKLTREEVILQLSRDLTDSISRIVAAYKAACPSLENADIITAIRTMGNIGLGDTSLHDAVAKEAAGDGGQGASSGQPKKPVRVYVDGCFDVMHSGHYNAIRQAKQLGDVLVVGVHTNEEIIRHKGPPVMDDEERLAMVRACKWVDEIVWDTPYNPSIALLDKHNCDFCVHGDDMPTTADGQDAYGPLKAAGRMRVIKRTEGISTTDLVGRLLLMTKSHHLLSTTSPQMSPMRSPQPSPGLDAAQGQLSPLAQAALSSSPPKHRSQPSKRGMGSFSASYLTDELAAFSLEADAADAGGSSSADGSAHGDGARLAAIDEATAAAGESEVEAAKAAVAVVALRTPAATEPRAVAAVAAKAAAPSPAPEAHYARGISSFLPTTWRITQFSNNRKPSEQDKVVYIDGAFDLFHVGHVSTLEKAKSLGTFLYVGIHDDATVNKMRGANYPIMNLHERVLNVLSCKYVDEVVIGAPWVITRDLIQVLNIDVVVSGSNTKMAPDYEGDDPCAAPKAMGIYHEIATSHLLSTDDVVQRIVENRVKYQKRNKTRSAKEVDYYARKEHVQEV